jgi:hypothetical protein
MLTLFIVSPLPAGASTLLHLRADHLDFYYDQFLVEGDGNVTVTTSDGFSVTGDTFSMDLKLNRFLVAGNVTLRYHGQSVSGAAVSDFLDFNRIYFVPITSEPDRWTFLNGDLAHPVKGREMPGDTFAFPQVGSKVSLTAYSAIIEARNYIKFSDATTYLGGIPFPLKSYYVNFGSSQLSQYLAQNSLSGASADATWNLAGNSNATTALHIRYDGTNYLYGSFEQHFAGEHEYAVFSLNPATKRQKFYNLLLYDRLGNRFQIKSFTQYFVNQVLFEQPAAATQTTYITATQAFNHSYLTAYGTFTDYNLLGPQNSSYAPYVPVGGYNHPSQVQFTYKSFDDQIFKLPLYFNYRGGYGFNYDTVGQPQVTGGVAGLQEFNGVVYTSIYNTLAGLTLYTTQIKIGNHDDPYKTFYVNGIFDKQRQWNSLPHHIDTTSTTLSLSRNFDRHFNSYFSYSIANTADIYKDGQGYPPSVPVINGVPVYSYQAFRGISTLRTSTLGINFVSNPDFVAIVTARKHDDFPIPYPDLFPLPPTNVLGQYIYSSYLGQAPYDVTPEVRARLAAHMTLDIARTYYFNFGGLKWNPSTIVQVLSQ